MTVSSATEDLRVNQDGTYEFDLERYITASRKIDVSDIDFDKVKEHPVSPEEIHCLTYMMDIERHTVVYLKGVLNTCAIEDSDITAFLSCWAYEEHFHGRVLKHFLAAAGHPFPDDRYSQVYRGVTWREWLEDMGASLICQISRHFHAAYLTWGAINELTTLECYGRMRQRTRNPVLADVLSRLMKDERRHYAFYYNQAKLRLAPRNAQRLTSFLLRNFWNFVGADTKPGNEVDRVVEYLLADEAGYALAQRVDATIGRLPGLSWFRLMTRALEQSLKRLGKPRPGPVAQAAVAS